MNKPRVKATLLSKSMKHILNHIEMFSADGAGNEQLAGRLLHPRVERAMDVEKLPNLKMVIRDKAHATRRLSQRTFKVDKELDDILNIMLFKKKPHLTTCIASMLRNSEPCAEVFQQEAKKQCQPSGAGSVPGGVVLNLSFAKHRFDSTAKPLGICVWNLDAVISTCHIIVRDKSFDKQYRTLCQQFLDELSPERILLLGMLADASEEVLTLVRFFDREAFDVSAMSEQVVAFKRRVRALFHDEACLTQGFTVICLKHLDTRKMVIDSAGNVKTIGGPGLDKTQVSSK
jgi:hypothetical protein